MAKADVNIADKDGQTPLIVAISQSDDDTVETLLAQDTTNVNAAENEGWTQLMLASVAGNETFVRSLLRRKASVHVANHARRTTLHKASFFGNGEIVRILLQDGQADPRNVDELGQTALHKASRRGYADIVNQLLVSMGDEDGANMADKDGWTALHYASCRRAETDDDSVEVPRESDDLGWIRAIALTSGSDAQSSEKVVKCLLAHGANVAAKNDESQTPLHLAASSGSYDKEIIGLLMERMNWEDMFAPNAKGETALFILAKEVANSPLSPDATNDAVHDQVLGWAAENRETHDIARLLLKKGKRAAAARFYLNPAENQNNWNALDWAACTGNDRIVWQLLYSMEPKPENDRNRKRALKIAAEIKDGLEATDLDGDRVVKRPKRVLRGPDGRVPDRWSRKREGEVTPKDANLQMLKTDEYERTVDLLRDPPFVPTSIPIERYEKPKAKAFMSDFDAVLADFYAEGSRTGFLRQLRHVEQVICKEGPIRIMTDARGWINGTSGKLNKTDGNKVFAKEDFKFRWIHLPANNMQWMNDLVVAIGLEEKREEGQLASMMSFFKKSWQEIPHGSSKSRLMKPHCVAEKSPWICTTRDSPKSQQGRVPAEKMETQRELENMMAVYIPYVRFGRIEENGPGDPKYQQLLDAYEGQTIHGTRTLDEFYYHTAGDDELERDMKRRNQDQVVTKELDGDVKKLGLKSWTVLQIDELWVWVLNKETIITSSTHRPDNVEDLATIILRELSKEPEAGKGRPQPNSAHMMSKFIVDSCVKFFTTRTNGEAQQTGIATKGTRKSLSAHQIFSYAINKAAIKEADLFENFTNDNLKSQAERGHISIKRRSNNIGATASLLCLIKDIRDELCILRALASYQKIVQERLLRSDPDVPRSANYIIKEIDEMDKVAKGIHNAVNATLTLQQSEIAISQSTEAVQQGRTLLVFTITTILFLPLSFFTSLFAVNITLFQHDDKGELLYSPNWIFPIIFGISIPIWIGCLLYAYWANLRLPSWLRRSKNGGGGGGSGGSTGDGPGGGGNKDDQEEKDQHENWTPKGG
ncbi:hypothetical protein MFIFM68171_10985 [Madurella fahalii]|uniref:Ankyrin repeat protein n=1 Tax=Madurella fahalii TaxID=1157608 RepID=A0ABQ0GSQ4_9PEZI